MTENKLHKVSLTFLGEYNQTYQTHTSCYYCLELTLCYYSYDVTVTVVICYCQNFTKIIPQLSVKFQQISANRPDSRRRGKSLKPVRRAQGFKLLFIFIFL